ncbi:MAG: extracellular solute-binding protein [Burkholderiaceae bacterium]|jgi:iron(III) transport system substrate-binding protein|nr:extracellular solute-binding protein [Burkholderiaceae bacterium]
MTQASLHHSAPAGIGKRRFSQALLAAGAMLAFPAVRGQSAPPFSGMDELAKYTGADREQRLADGARKEGALTIYTTFAEKDLPVLIKPFEDKYGIKVTVWRAGTDTVLQRTLAENSAGRHTVDVIHFGAPEMEALAREKVLRPVYSPAYQDLQPGSVPAHRQWAATLLSVWVAAYNTDLIKKEDLPKTYADLLDPKWKGKLGVEAKNQDWFSTVVGIMGGGEKGLQFFRDLVAINGVSPRKGHTQLNNMVISGEVPLALTIYNYMPEQARKKGAPINWFVIEPAVARANAVGVTVHAPHPAAALLFHEYFLTDAQAYIQSMDYVPSSKRVDTAFKGVKIIQTDPAQTLDEADKWSRLFDDIVVSKGGRK